MEEQAAHYRLIVVLEDAAGLIKTDAALQNALAEVKRAGPVVIGHEYLAVFVPAMFEYAALYLSFTHRCSDS